MTRAVARRPLAVRLYHRLLTLLLPRRFGDAFAREMTLVFADLHAAATRSGGVFRGGVALAAELPGLLRLALRERRLERAERLRLQAVLTPHVPDGNMMDSLTQDLRYAFRSLRRTPGFTTVAVLTLALGVGANTAIFSVVDGVLLRPLPLHEPERLLAVGESVRDGSPTDMNSTTAGSFFDWKRQARAVQLAGYSTTSATLTGTGDPERIPGTTAIGGLFEVLGVPAVLGRTLVETEEAPGAERVIVLSHGLWQRLFGTDSDVVGRTLTLNGEPFTVVGVMEADFRFPDGASEYWAPLRQGADARANRDQYFIQVVGRLAPGATIEQAGEELAAVAEGLRRDWPLYNSDLRIAVRPLRDTIVGSVRTRLLVVMGAVALVLLITCANLGNLLLARASVRRREIAVRRALGAGRMRVVRQLLTESLLLAAAGGAAGVLVGHWFLQLLLAAQSTTNLPRIEGIGLDHRVLLFTLGVSIVAGLLFGSLPAWQLTGTSNEALRTGARGATGRQWTRSTLVVAQVAMAMVLLTGAGLLLRSFVALQRVDPGFTAKRILAFDVSLPDPGLPFFSASLDRIRAIPGVRAAALVSQFPVSGRGIGAWFNRLDRPLPPEEKPPAEAYRVVSPEYFETIGLPLKRGRFLTEDDRLERPAVVINEALARRHYASEDPIGEEIYLGAPDNRLFPRATIVGVVGDTRDAGLGSDPLPTVYIPFGVMPRWRFATYVVRTEGAPQSVAAAVRTVMREMDAGLPLRNVRTLEDVLGVATATARWSSTLLGVFAFLALAMAALGLFGVLSFVVTQRTRELGICIALGAAPRTMRRMVLRQGLALIGGGLVVGLLGALALTRLMTSLLHGVAPTDPATYGAVAAMLMGIALLASYLPAHRATRIDPMVALRAE